MFCNKCGHELSDNSMFCSNCGNKITVGNEVEDKTDEDLKPNYKRLFIFFSILAIIAIITFAIPSYEPKPKRMEDYTNKEMKNFLEWRDQEKQKQHDNEKFFK